MGKDHFKDLSIHERIILKWIFKETRCEGVDWIKLAQDKVQWSAQVNMVINLQVL